MRSSRRSKAYARNLVGRCLKDSEFRIRATCGSHALFFLVYLSSHLEYELAPFQKRILDWTQRRHFGMIVVAAFRGAGKSTICTVSLPLWMILGMPGKKYVLIVARTQEQARRLIANIINEIEGNELLKRDLGPLHYEEDEQRRFSVELGKHGALIQAVSLEQSIRGLKHGAHRPDLIICDDLEDSDAAQTGDHREALYRRFTGEILMLGDLKTDVVVLGNTVHEEGLILTLGKQIEEGERKGYFGRFPIVEHGKPLWPGKFKSLDDVEAERRKIGDEAIWRRENLLDPRSDIDAIVRDEWFLTWDALPTEFRAHARVLGVDLAFSTGPRSDYTAIVPADVFWTDEGFEIFILPEIVNARLDPLAAKRRVFSLARGLSAGRSKIVKVFMEDMGAQRLYIEEWRKEGIHATGVPLRGMSKEERMAVAAPFVQRGVIRLPVRGAEVLRRQITELGLGGHDDLADAFTTLILGVRDMRPPSRSSISGVSTHRIEEGRRGSSFWYPDHSGDRDGPGESILTEVF